MGSGRAASGIALGLAMAGAFSCSLARAGQTNAGVGQPLQALLDCRAIADEGLRLRCLDARTSEVEAMLTRGDIVVVTRTQVAQAQAAQFGRSAPAPAITIQKQEQTPPLPTSIDTSIKAVSRTVDGKWVMILADGARWQQIDGRILARDPKPGMAIAIRRAAMGSYLANVAGQPALRVRRVN